MTSALLYSYCMFICDWEKQVWVPLCEVKWSYRDETGKTRKEDMTRLSLRQNECDGPTAV